MSRTFAVTLGLWTVALAVGRADELRIGRTAVLSGTLPTATGWQVEMQQGGGAWTGTGVILAGRGVVTTVRMEGWPGEAAYRFQRVDGGATVAATLAGGMHLAGQVTTAELPPVMIQNSENLGAWTTQELVFPGLDGSYVRALNEPVGAKGFFRASVGAAVVSGDASATQYSPPPPYQGSADYGPLYDDMPQIFKDGYVTAIASTEFNRGGQAAAAAGECYELAGPFGSTTVMVSDEAPSPPAGTVNAGRGFFDLGLEPFKVLSGGVTDGVLTVGSRLVPAPVTGNVKLYVVQGSNPYFMALRPFNHRAGVSKMEFLNGGGGSTWVTMTRQAGNRFIYTGGAPVTYPVQVRVTSRFDEAVTFTGISSLNESQKITGPAQFIVFPEQAPTPQRRIRPVYQDALANVPGDAWQSSSYGGATVTAVDTAVKYTGSASLRVNGFAGFSGVILTGTGAFPRPENGILRLAIRSALPVAAGQVQLRIQGANEVNGGGEDSAFIPLPALTTGWQVLRFPLEASGTAALVRGLTLVNGTSTTLPNVWLDEVEFLKR